MQYKSIFTVASSLVLLLSLSACGATDTVGKETKPSDTSNGSIAAGSAVTALMKLPVKAMDHTDDYKRTYFGKAWADVDNNGCDTRNDILARDLTDIKKTDNCVVQTGLFADPYTGKTINFDKSKGGGGGIDIDHIIPLSLAWQTGAASWDDAKRLAYANDNMVLLASDSSENRKKGDKDASKYLPPNVGFQCEYVARQITVRKNFEMWVTPEEKSAMQKVLNTCPQQPLLTGNPKATSGKTSQTPPSAQAIVPTTEPAMTEAPVAPVEPTVAPQPAPVIEPTLAPQPKPAVEPSGDVDPKFPSCKAAKEAGFGPYTSSQTEYSWYKDSDKDGTVCE